MAEMVVEIGTSLDYKCIPKDSRCANGCACSETQVCFIFLNNLIDGTNIYILDMVQVCWDCENNVNGLCSKDIEPMLFPIISELNRVVLHEILHLCGCEESQARSVDRRIHPFEICPFTTDEKLI